MHLVTKCIVFAILLLPGEKFHFAFHAKLHQSKFYSIKNNRLL